MSAEQLCALSDYDGFAIGGLSVGEPNQDMYDTVEWTTQFMPTNKPRYLMGVGTPEDLIENIPAPEVKKPKEPKPAPTETPETNKEEA